MLVWVWNANELKAVYTLKQLPGWEPAKPAETGDSLQVDSLMEMVAEQF